MKLQEKTAIGLYLDSAMSGIDISIFKTDGLDILSDPISITRPYPAHLKEALLNLKYPEDFTSMDYLKELSTQVTTLCIQGVRELIEQTKDIYESVDIIGFSGQNIYHTAADKFSISLGDAEQLAEALNCPVIDHFIQTDLKAGGVGGPLLPVFLDARAKHLEKPVGFIVLRGISALCLIGSVGNLQAFEVGAGVWLIDRWMQRHAGLEMDFDGQYATKGTVDERVLKCLMTHPFLQKKPPKTATKEDFLSLLEQTEGLSAADGAATLTAFVAHSIVQAVSFLTEKPDSWILIGGGSENPALVHILRTHLKEPIHLSEEYGWDKNMFTAQTYAFLAVRSQMNLPITFPQTTGVIEPMSGGTPHFPPKSEEMTAIETN